MVLELSEAESGDSIMLKVGDVVEYKKPFFDEIGSKYKIIWLDANEDACEFEAIVPMMIRPIYAARISDMRVVNEA
jgi:hypothetical protein